MPTTIGILHHGPPKCLGETRVKLLSEGSGFVNSRHEVHRCHHCFGGIADQCR